MFLNAASNLGRSTDGVFVVFVVVSAALLILITLLMVFFVVRYDRRRHPVASDTEGSTFLEWAWTIGGVALVLFLFYLGLGGFTARTTAPPGAMDIKVTARMWSWSFEYPNGVKSPKLVLAEGAPVRLALNSPDTIHSLYVPAFRVKQDVVPGTERFLWFTPDEVGGYDLFCAEYCGLGHSRMLTRVEVLTARDFNAWYGEAVARVGAPDGAALYVSKGCVACHSLDGSRMIGPTWKGLYGKEVTVATGGHERVVIVDEAHLRRSILDPNADVVVGFPQVMPSQKGALTSEEVEAIIGYIKSLEEKADVLAAEQRAMEERAAEKRAALKLAAEKKAAEKLAAEKKAAEKFAAEQKAVEKKAVEKKAAERKAAEQKAAEKRAAEKRAAEQKAAEKKAAERKAAEKKAAEKKAAEKKAAEKREAEKPAPPAPPAPAPAVPAVKKKAVEKEKVEAQEPAPAATKKPVEEKPAAPPVEERPAAPAVPAAPVAPAPPAPPALPEVKEEARPEVKGKKAAEKPAVAPAKPSAPPAGPAEPRGPLPDGAALYRSKGCSACHSADGSGKAGPTFKGLFWKDETVITGGVERVVTADEVYLRRAILDPNADVVKGFEPVMPSGKGVLTDREVDAIIEYIKTLR